MPDFKVEGEAVTFWLRVKPRAARERLTLDAAGELRLELHAPPADGAANEACIKFFAHALRLPQSCVEIVSGHKARRKLMRVSGRPAEQNIEQIKKAVTSDTANSDRLSMDDGNKSKIDNRQSTMLWSCEEIERLSFGQRLAEIRTGFERAFWVANFTELFERLAYYGASAVLAIYLTEQLHFSKELTGWMMGTFGFVVWLLPVLGGTLADRFGFRRALMFAYLVMTVGYFLLGSLSAPWMQGVRHALGDKWLVFAILMVPALGPAMVKPCVAGTTARASTENVRSIGYSIYYTIVNIGGTLGPIVAWLVRKQLGWGIASVFRVSALSVFLMFLVTMLFFQEPTRSGEQQVASVAHAIEEHVRGLGQFPLRSIPPDLFQFLHRILAGIHFRATFPARLCESQCQCGPGALR